VLPFQLNCSSEQHVDKHSEISKRMLAYAKVQLCCRQKREPPSVGTAATCSVPVQYFLTTQLHAEPDGRLHHGCGSAMQQYASFPPPGNARHLPLTPCLPKRSPTPFHALSLPSHSWPSGHHILCSSKMSATQLGPCANSTGRCILWARGSAATFDSLFICE
jgi:hypothetical protein